MANKFDAAFFCSTFLLGIFCAEATFHGQTINGIVTPVSSLKDYRATNAAGSGYTRYSVSEDHCVTLCVFEYKMTGKCSSVNYDGQGLTCYINTKHEKDVQAITTEQASGWIWHDLGFGPPEKPFLSATPAGYDMIEGSSIDVVWRAGKDGGFQQTFKIEYVSYSTMVWKDNLVSNSTKTSMYETITGLIPGTTYTVVLTATNSRPIGVTTASVEVTVITDGQAPTTEAPSTTTSNETTSSQLNSTQETPDATIGGSYPFANCSMYATNNYPSGQYYIDPDGMSGYLSPFLVTCDMATDPPQALFGHDYEMAYKYVVQNGTSLIFAPTYNNSVTMEMMIAVINSSSGCSQFVRKNCNGSATTTPQGSWLTYLVDRKGDQMNYWGGSNPTDGHCACKAQFTCPTCNCDIAEDLSYDEGDLTTKNDLPVTAVYGSSDPPGSFSSIVLGPLKCNN